MKTPLSLLVSIVDRGNDKGILRILREQDVQLYWCCLGCGTAHSEIMDYLGLDEPEKDIILCVVDTSRAQEIMHSINDRMKLNRRGAGIMFTVPTSAINADASDYIKLSNNTQGEEKNMNEQECKLIVNVVSRGLSDVVMKAAVAAGATGGTIMRSRGIGPDDADGMKKLFFQPEKEVVLLVVKQENAKSIMESICDYVNREANERIITFALPIDSTLGIYHGDADK